MSHRAARIRADRTDLVIMRAVQAYEKRDANGILLGYNSIKSKRKGKFNFDKSIFFIPSFNYF